ncbi:MAG TPA: hypothetical protein VNK67_15235 [Burkholderiales bacterium]|nr:hypothetical protein [Burkholderiales bacterium]
MAHEHGAARADAGEVSYWQEALRKTTEIPECKRDLEANHRSDEFMTGAEPERALERMPAVLRILPGDIGLAKWPCWRGGGRAGRAGGTVVSAPLPRLYRGGRAQGAS